MEEVFFTDARQKLVGPRPASAAAAAGDNSNIKANVNQQPPSGATAQGGFSWSQLIEPEVLEDEVKAVQRRIGQSLESGTKFKGGGYKQARADLSVLATVYAIIAEYDGHVRWKDQAAGVRNLMARAGFNCKVGTDASFKEARLRRDDLDQLVQGGTVEAPKAEVKAKWDAVSGRPPLMQRLEQAHQQGLTPWTSDAGQFKQHSGRLLHEAQVLAAIAEVIQRDGFEYTDDESYLGFAKAMRGQAQEVTDAVQKNDYERARKAVGQIEKSCSSCHEAFRS